MELVKCRLGVLKAMLVEFRLKNYGCIHDEQTLSMVAGPHRASAASPRLYHASAVTPPLLPVAVLFGPNGSGKSTIVKALDFMRRFVVASAKGQEGEAIDVTPFLLRSEGKSRPSEFEVVFVHSGVRYQYGFSADSYRVHDEWLFAVREGGRTQRWIERRYDRNADKYDIYINSSLKGEREVWKKSTRDNALLLSVAVQLKAESLREPFDWFQNRLNSLSRQRRFCKSSGLSDRGTVVWGGGIGRGGWPGCWTLRRGSEPRSSASSIWRRCAGRAATPVRTAVDARGGG